MISGIVLAAGLSTRMGRPKQDLLLAGRPMLERSIDAFLSSSADEVIVIVSGNRPRRSMNERPRLRFVVNPNPARGLSSSVALGLLAVEDGCEAAVIGLADKPLVLPSTIDRLIAAFERTRSPIVIPTFKRTRGNPILFERTMFPAILALKGDVGAKEVIRRNEKAVLEVEVDDGGVLIDIDTPSDLKAAEASMSPGRSSEGREPGQ